MRLLTEEWVAKADADLMTATRELRARTRPNYDASCFHAQQCAEKYPKALLQEHDVEFGKTHNLLHLLEQVSPIDSSLLLMKPVLQMLQIYAVDFRYPGESADRDMAKQAVRAAEQIKNTIVPHLVESKTL